ncbi:MAG: Preprotein translocase subunit SecD [Candidatus Kaiserbacteria bacterium GW2011_GWA2_58_9]|uniref:Protein translocase subunit SecD n=1 Tax=Candidatus Kaiserbacteria bacterium GW2011_GWA2_58_9 TaxID=1618672 RepID=A0A0G1YXK3_9BACT|nr:MAG: Preprotein translocase subunit SecD [Candidatus Kaiserbacteria bacterium GW2011_GWA2_58_9]
MLQRRLVALAVLLIGAGIGWYVYSSQMSGSRPFKLGLDLSGGTQLVYRAKLDAIRSTDVADSMVSLRDTIERRVNLFGVSEPIVQTQRGGTLAGQTEERLIVELPGITDTQKAIKLIGQTPVLEFRLLKGDVPPADISESVVNQYFEPAAITGKDVQSAQLEFNQALGGIPNEPVVLLTFDSEGTRIFGDLTRGNVGRYFGMFLDGVPISIPVINEPIHDGKAVISGNFTPEEAKELARNLNYGALPVPIELISTQTVSGTLGAEAVEAGVAAGLWGVALVALFMFLWYRLPGVVAVLALLLYVLVVLALFQLIPVTLTAAGIAAFILSVGMAVDANVLIFERMKEELRGGKSTGDAIRDGFARAWPSIRDSNISSMITAVILFWFGTSLIKGFALVFGLGVLVSMLTAITVSRTFLLALGIDAKVGITRFLFGSGLFARSSLSAEASAQAGKLEARS